jgi:hypothetical protein
MDEGFISKYAEDNPEREDLAETMLLYLAYRFWPERITQETFETIESTIPNRIMYLDCQSEVGIDLLEWVDSDEGVVDDTNTSRSDSKKDESGLPGLGSSLVIVSIVAAAVFTSRRESKYM